MLSSVVTYIEAHERAPLIQLPHSNFGKRYLCPYVRIVVPLVQASALPLSLAPRHPLPCLPFRTSTSSYGNKPLYSRTIDGLPLLFSNPSSTSQKLFDVRPIVRQH